MECKAVPQRKWFDAPAQSRPSLLYVSNKLNYDR
tara:strand:+ start:2112 stop:2213 length:102 start_codon:yes stop_codon:yes gene_type:complete